MGVLRAGSDFSVYYGNRNIIWNTYKNYPNYLILLGFSLFVRNLDQYCIMEKREEEELY